MRLKANILFPKISPASRLAIMSMLRSNSQGVDTGIKRNAEDDHKTYIGQDNF
jgi:hypothetical protein